MTNRKRNKIGEGMKKSLSYSQNKWVTLQSIMIDNEKEYNLETRERDKKREIKT